MNDVQVEGNIVLMLRATLLPNWLLWAVDGYDKNECFPIPC